MGNKKCFISIERKAVSKGPGIKFMKVRLTGLVNIIGFTSEVERGIIGKEYSFKIVRNIGQVVYEK